MSSDSSVLEIGRRSLLTTGVAAAATSVLAGAARAANLPFKLFDTHVHFISDDLARYPLTTKMAPGLGGAPPPSPGAPNVPASSQGALGLRERIAHAPTTPQAVFALWDATGVEAGVGVQYRTAYGADNSYLLDCADRFPRRIRPVVVLDAEAPGTADQLRSMAERRGVTGVRLTGLSSEPGLPWLASASALRTWAVAEELGLVVVLMSFPAQSSPTTLRAIADLADRHPNARVVLDHCGWLGLQGPPEFGIDAAHAALAAHRNIGFKFSTINLNMLAQAGLPAPPVLRRLVDIYGAERIMWGSDLGNSQGPYASMVSRMLDATSNLHPAERRQVLRETGRAVFVRGGSRSRRG